MNTETTAKPHFMCSTMCEIGNYLRRMLAVVCFVAFAFGVQSIASGTTLGNVQFSNSCKVELNSQFNEAVALLHSFEFKEAVAIFEQVERRDPTCSIAAWGVALANTEWDGANASPKTLHDGWEQLRPWLSVQAATQREQMYLDAIRGMYEGYSDIPGSVRWRRYLGRMATIRGRYPQDSDAAMFYALGLVWTAGEGKKGIQRRRRALRILLPLFSELPDHPGAAHYIIHAADTPELAAVALPAARKYAEIAPASPHAIHMPSHIFSRLGYWPEMIQSNEESARVAAEWVRDGRNGRFDEQHALTYLEYGYLQLSQRDNALEQISRIREVMSGPGGDSWAEVDARISYDVETADWPDALKVEPPPTSPFQENFDVFWVHAMAASRLGRIQDARTSLTNLSESIAQQRSGINYAHILHIYLLQAQAAVQEAEGKSEEAIHTLRSAVVYERAHPVDYPNVLAPPSAEILGTLFLRLHKLSDARGAFQQSLRMAPNRLNSLEGLKQSQFIAGPLARLTLVRRTHGLATALIAQTVEQAKAKDLGAGYLSRSFRRRPDRSRGWHWSRVLLHNSGGSLLSRCLLRSFLDRRTFLRRLFNNGFLPSGCGFLCLPFRRRRCSLLRPTPPCSVLDCPSASRTESSFLFGWSLGSFRRPRGWL
jgi:tetratricopeptide (TPR) repeat protein